jgi:hypothetical protein
MILQMEMVDSTIYPFGRSRVFKVAYNPKVTV